MIALEFPPCQSAGVQRTLKFAEYLVTLGWQPIVLTVNSDVYTSVDSQVTIPDSIKVYRCKSLDAAKDLSIKGKYFAWSKVPDRWWSWAVSAIPLGKKLINKYKPDIIWSTYPVSTAHFIAYKLQKHSQLPWVADFRDPLQCRYDVNAKPYSSIPKWIEKKTIENCTKAVFTTENAAQLYRRLYLDEKLTKFTVIENGFDEGNFQDIEIADRNKADIFTLLHSGSIYENGRDPSKLFIAISELFQEGLITEMDFELVFRGASADRYSNQIKQLGIERLVHFKSNVPYKESLAEMAKTSALLLVQGGLFKNQIPGKAYEYIRCNKAILALTPKEGSTGLLLSKVDSTEVVDEVEEIKHAIAKMLAQVDSPNRDSMQFSRYSKTQQLDVLLRTLC
ncbi:hypothetical protein CXF71_12250 [Colwellia sp. 12G3]|nr:hypothetical protein CXF71_12250 [Colwellia sp. 12G3]